MSIDIDPEHCTILSAGPGEELNAHVINEISGEIETSRELHLANAGIGCIHFRYL